jgi:hypothetical protein
MDSIAAMKMDKAISSCKEVARLTPAGPTSRAQPSSLAERFTAASQRALP